MAESELYMQCEEEELAPCQNNTDEADQTVNINNAVQNGCEVLSAAPPDCTLVVSPSVSSAPTPSMGGIKTTVLPIAPAPAVHKPLLSSVLQPIQIAAGGNPGQSIYIASQAPSGTPQSFGSPIGYILPAGQAVTFLTPAQTGQFITQQLPAPSAMPRAVTPGNFSTVQIPVTLTIRGASGVQSIATVASSRMTGLGVTPSNLPPLSSPAISGTTVRFTTPPPSAPPVAGQVGSPQLQPAKVVPVPAPVSTKALSPCALAAKPQAQTSTPSTSVNTKVFQNASRLPQTCSTCGTSYKTVQSLRGYVCQCNPELIKSIQALSLHPKKKKTKRISISVRSTPSSHKTSSSMSIGSRHPVASPPVPLKHITTSEIPEGAPSPGTGDYDQHGKLIILVEDFYYGKDPGQPVVIETSQVPVMMKCHLCDKKLKNNVKLMNHMKHHMEMERQRGDVDCHIMCQHCFRPFGTPFTLQCHLETVHSQVESTAVCKICELSFENEPLFLNHMKNVHKPGEMPYICQVCNFRSSFYHDVVVHFREIHKDSNNLLCPYCLKVFKSSNSYQIHYSKHQKKSVLHCDKCRLQFLFSKDKADHKALYHQTHLKPAQLMGLKPGTRVTIRAYSMTKTDENMGFKGPSNTARSPTVKEVSPTPVTPTTPIPAHSVPAPQNAIQKIIHPKRKPVESMLDLLARFQSHCEPPKKQLCMECNFEIPDFSRHFPTFVHCSLCHYSTCCSRAYANHMISNHVSRKSNTKYLNLYKPCPRMGQLSCCSCDYTTQVGDLMAKHLVDYPGHCASLFKFNEGFSRGYKRFVFIPTDLIRGGQGLNTGTFMPLQVLQVSRSSLPHPTKPATQPNHCINLPVSSVHIPSIPIQVQPVDQSTVPDENCGTEPKDSTLENRELPSGSPTEPEDTTIEHLTLAQLKIVLYALCFGVPQAANHFDTQPREVQSLLLKRQLQLGSPKSREGLIPRASDRLAEWVLCQREQQLPVDEGNLFSKASEFMSTDGGPGITYQWAVDFLLLHDLGLQALVTSRRLLPHKAQERVYSFTHFINKQVTSQSFGMSVIGAMDELSIFIDMEQLDPASADSSSMMSTFKLVGETDPLMDVVFAALADGTMLPTMVFLRGEPLSPDAPALPDIIVLEAKPEGFSDEERLQLWLDKVWRLHLDPSSGGKGLLVMDTYRGHITNDFLASLNSANTLPGMVPRACTSRLQPLEACIGPVFREFLQARWSQHVTEAPQDLIGAEPADLALLLSAWLTEMLDVLAAKPELLQQSFHQMLNTNPEMTPTGLSELVRNLTEALVVTALQDQEDEAEARQKRRNSEVASPTSLPSPPANQALKKIFEKDSDLESFHGFEDAEMMDC
ncbi:pogo transposable element derived with ZNF domain a [Electrophorus electricus]|uniref:pogo transposable element derived with ZNF domain a n=1 Tax=Electrophorus electricus TaxID=8005 RepID=UPI0015CFB2B3|nr:pogo transposable element derived with ZNF domain a [Electrophorus electricus]